MNSSSRSSKFVSTISSALSKMKTLTSSRKPEIKKPKSSSLSSSIGKINDELSDIIEAYKFNDLYTSLQIEIEKKEDINKIFTDLQLYCNKIDINIHLEIIIYLAKLIIINMKSKNEKEKENIKNFVFNYIVSNIINYYYLIIEKYNALYDDLPDLSVYITSFDFILILLLYSYYYYINKLIDYIYDDDIDDDDKNPDSEEFLYKLLKLESNIDTNIKQKLYIKLINKFNQEILFNEEEITSISSLYIIKKYNSSSFSAGMREYGIEKNIFTDELYKLIKRLSHYTLLLENDYSSNNYITIPQYIGNCWFISMLTAMCYSDLSKELLKKQLKEIKLETKSKNSEQIFISIVSYLIVNITNKHKKYNASNKKEGCEYLKFFKNNLNNFLFESFEEFKIKDYESNQNRDWFNINDLEYAGMNDYYYKDIYAKYIQQYRRHYNPNDNEENMSKYILTDKKIQELEINMGIIFIAYLLINTLYNILNVRTLYLYDYSKNKDHYLMQKNIEYEKEKTLEDPDIIFLNKYESDELNKHLEDINKYKSNTFVNLNKSEIKLDADKKHIKYKSNDYELDYIIQTTDFAKTCVNCGHCISCIQYNKMQYIHDSGTIYKSINCDQTSRHTKDINISCPLIRHDWKDNLNNKNQFCTTSCIYKNTDNESQFVYKDVIYHNRICFDNTDNIICAYIKVDPATMKGGNNKYKSTHKKVNILNKNNKIIERIIHIDNNKNKFIKLNKIFQSLKSFKYNKKNKYYYI